MLICPRQLVMSPRTHTILMSLMLNCHPAVEVTVTVVMMVSWSLDLERQVENHVIQTLLVCLLVVVMGCH